jgi:hypothetical protein
MTTKNMAHIRIEPTRGVCRFITSQNFWEVIEQSIFNDKRKAKTIRHKIVGSVNMK